MMTEAREGAAVEFEGTAGSDLKLEFNLKGVAFIVGSDCHARGVALSPIDARIAAAEILRLATFSETYGTVLNPIRIVTLQGDPEYSNSTGGDGGDIGKWHQIYRAR